MSEFARSFIMNILICHYNLFDISAFKMYGLNINPYPSVSVIKSAHKFTVH